MQEVVSLRTYVGTSTSSTKYYIDVRTDVLIEQLIKTIKAELA